jgi:TldD protein
MNPNEVKDLLLNKGGYILSTLLSKGGVYAEIFYERSLFTRIYYENGKVDKVSRGWEMGVGLRLIKDFKVFYGYTNNPTFENLLQLARLLAKGEGQGPVKWGLIKREGQTETKVDPEGIAFSQKVELLKRADQRARELGKDLLKQVLVGYADKTREILVINSLGEIAEDTQKRVVLFVETVVGKDVELFRGY